MHGSRYCIDLDSGVLSPLQLPSPAVVLYAFCKDNNPTMNFIQDFYTFNTVRYSGSLRSSSHAMYCKLTAHYVILKRKAKATRTPTVQRNCKGNCSATCKLFKICSQCWRGLWFLENTEQTMHKRNSVVPLLLNYLSGFQCTLTKSNRSYTRTTAPHRGLAWLFKYYISLIHYLEKSQNSRLDRKSVV